MDEGPDEGDAVGIPGSTTNALLASGLSRAHTGLFAPRPVSLISMAPLPTGS